MTQKSAVIVLIQMKLTVIDQLQTMFIQFHFLTLYAYITSKNGIILYIYGLYI